MISVYAEEKVYPRVCGGTPMFGTGTVITNGLSPRVRGNLPTLAAWPPCGRSIPACAGEPS